MVRSGLEPATFSATHARKKRSNKLSHDLAQYLNKYLIFEEKKWRIIIWMIFLQIFLQSKILVHLWYNEVLQKCESHLDQKMVKILTHRTLWWQMTKLMKQLNLLFFTIDVILISTRNQKACNPEFSKSVSRPNINYWT